jgi:steroid 5-alpha reductase family enzyme
VMLGLIAWIIASARRNVGLVDICWSLFFLSGTLVFVAERRPAYRDYVARTNAFLPGCRHR